MFEGIENMTPEEVAAAIQALQARDREINAERRASEDIDRALRRRLQKNGVSLGDPWVQPTGLQRAYPYGWAVQHVGHWWDANDYAVMSEPAEGNPDWVLNDPDPDLDETDEPNAEEAS